jgi:hypothetical protein
MCRDAHINFEPVSSQPEEQDVQGERETFSITRAKADGEPCAWRAEVRSTQAAQECAKRSFKCIYAATLPDLTARNCEWRQAQAP